MAVNTEIPVQLTTYPMPPALEHRSVPQNDAWEQMMGTLV